MIEFIVAYILGSVVTYFTLESKHNKRVDKILENINSQSVEEALS